MPATALVLEVHAVAARHATWCTACALPSAVDMDLVLADARTLRILGRSTVWRCLDCGAEGRR